MPDNHSVVYYLREAVVKSLLVSCRELEARVGATLLPFPSDHTDSAILMSRITQLSRKVKARMKRLAEVEAKSEGIYCVCMWEGDKLQWVLGFGSADDLQCHFMLVNACPHLRPLSFRQKESCKQ